MRFMMLVKATRQSEAGVMPEEKILAAMAKYNQELVRAGVLLDGAGLQPSSKGVRVRFSQGKRTVVEGPFGATNELVAGYWLIQVQSKEEAIEWARRAPMDASGREAEIEIRQLFELEDFPPSEAIEHHREVEKELAKNR